MNNEENRSYRFIFSQISQNIMRKCRCTFSICLVLLVLVFVFRFTFWSASSLSRHFCSYVFLDWGHHYSYHVKVRMKKSVDSTQCSPIFGLLEATVQVLLMLCLINFNSVSTSAFVNHSSGIKLCPRVHFSACTTQLPPPKRKNRSRIAYSEVPSTLTSQFVGLNVAMTFIISAGI